MCGGPCVSPRRAPAACGERSQRELKSDCYIHTRRKSTVIPGEKQNKTKSKDPQINPNPTDSLPKPGGHAWAFLLPESRGAPRWVRVGSSTLFFCFVLVLLADRRIRGVSLPCSSNLGIGWKPTPQHHSVLLSKLSEFFLLIFFLF